jgi:hypothetical protein
MNTLSIAPAPTPHPLLRMAALAVIVGTVGYLVRSLLAGQAEHQRRGGSKTTRPVSHDVGRWDNEGGMIATTGKAAVVASKDRNGFAPSALE